MLHPVSAVHDISSFDRALEVLPDAPGTYVFYVSAGLMLPEPMNLLAALQGDVVLYVGMTEDSLRRRIEQHLFRDSRVSSLRGNFGLLMQNTLGLELIRTPGKRHFCFRNEAPITDWIAQHARLGFSESVNPAQTEADWLALAPGLLNVGGRPRTILTEKIRALRKSASGRGLHMPTQMRAGFPARKR